MHFQNLTPVWCGLLLQTCLKKKATKTSMWRTSFLHDTSEDFGTHHFSTQSPHMFKRLSDCWPQRICHGIEEINFKHQWSGNNSILHNTINFRLLARCLKGWNSLGVWSGLCGKWSRTSHSWHTITLLFQTPFRILGGNSPESTQQENSTDNCPKRNTVQCSNF